MFRSLFFRFSTSEPQLQSHLHDARISGSCYITKAILSGIVEIPGRVIELRMIEDVESFRAELEFVGVLDLGILQQREIEVVDAGSDKEPAHRISDLAKRLLHKVVWIEVGKTVAWVPVRKQFVPGRGAALDGRGCARGRHLHAHQHRTAGIGHGSRDRPGDAGMGRHRRQQDDCGCNQTQNRLSMQNHKKTLPRLKNTETHPRPEWPDRIRIHAVSSATF